MTTHLQDKTAIVTGAAQGIGRAIATRLAAAGANVVISDIDEAAAKSVAAELPNATAVACDVRDEDDVKALVDAAVNAYGALHVMVPNAGIAHVAPLLTQDLAAWRKVMAVNLDGVFLSLRHAAPAIIASGGGSIVNIASVTATAGTPLCGSYAAAKAAVVNLTKTAAVELRAHGVRVNAVLPGFVETALVTEHVELFESTLGLPAGGFAQLIATKQGRFGTADEVADAVAFLAGEDSRFVNGSGLILDGGLDAGLF